MSDTERVLEQIEKCIVEHGGDLGGWTRLDGESLQLFDGRVTLTVDGGPEIPSPGENKPVHIHVLTKLHEHDDEVMDACLVGFAGSREESLAQVAMLWVTCVAGPIRSFLDNKPVCNTCQAGVQGGNPAEGYLEGDYGFAPGLRAYVGPAIARFIDDGEIVARMDEHKPWFRFAAESAAPRRVHLAKTTIQSQDKAGWDRQLEVDGHDVRYQDPNWPAGVKGPKFGYVTRFAVFEFPQNSAEIRRRGELERAIRHFAANYNRFESVDALLDEMTGQGFDAEIAHEVEAFSTIAFGRTLFEHMGVQYSPTIIRARRDGTVETDVPLMSLPAYARARAIAAQLRQTMPQEEFQAICLYNAESHAIVKMLEDTKGKPDLSKCTLYPLVVPEHGTSDETMEKAMAILHGLIDENRAKRKKPWWKFW